MRTLPTFLTQGQMADVDALPGDRMGSVRERPCPRPGAMQ